MLHYCEILRKLYAIHPQIGMKAGLDNMWRLDALLGYPSRAFRSVHIAGTNGKGSVVAKVAKGLQVRFPKVGVYTSPHLSCFRERIRINDTFIPEAAVEAILPQIFTLSEEQEISATIFELITLLAFVYFAEQRVDHAVIETGLGGRLDATNILRPELCIITSIDFDHVELLGSTLEAIGQEKAGITKPYVPVILGPSAAFIRPDPLAPTMIVPRTSEEVEQENRAIARTALEFFHIPEPEIRKAITTKPSCRREWIHFQGQDILLDVSHNPQGLQRLFKDLSIPKERLHVVFAISSTKDLAACAQIVSQAAQEVHLVDTGSARCCAPAELNRLFLLNEGVEEDIFLHQTVSGGIRDALHRAKHTHGTVVVCGTFFMMAEARAFLGIKEPRDPLDL